jgi:hypothetical protein
MKPTGKSSKMPFAGWLKNDKKRHLVLPGVAAQGAALRAGFKQCYQDKDFKTIVQVGDRIPNNLLMVDEVMKALGIPYYLIGVSAIALEENHTVNFNERYTDLHVLGFREVMEEAVQVNIEEKIANIPPLPGMVILKLIAWSDRPEEREDDLPDILKIIEHYYNLAWDEIVENHNDTFDKDPFDEKIIAAEVLGRKSRLYLEKSEAISARILHVLNSNLQDASKSAIARVWARKLDADIEYAFSLLNAFNKGITGKTPST